MNRFLWCCLGCLHSFFRGNSCTCPMNDENNNSHQHSSGPDSSGNHDNINLPFSTGKVNHEEDTTDKLSSQIYVNQGKKLAAFI